MVHYKVHCMVHCTVHHMVLCTVHYIVHSMEHHIVHCIVHCIVTAELHTLHTLYMYMHGCRRAVLVQSYARMLPHRKKFMAQCAHRLEPCTYTLHKHSLLEYLHTT